jgi:hypothetical protein
VLLGQPRSRYSRVLPVAFNVAAEVEVAPVVDALELLPAEGKRYSTSIAFFA